MKIAVLTATYNRAELIKDLYASLKKQNDADFVWIVVDDGSTDNTENVIREMISEKPGFEIRYLKKENGGKADALNYAFSESKDIDFLAVIDSDDIVIENAIETIKKKAYKYQDDAEVGAIYFRYVDRDGSIVKSKSRKPLRDKEVVLTRYEHDLQYSKDDGCIGYYARAVKKYAFPVYPGEKYVGPTVLQMLMADEYKIVFTNEVIGVAEYLEGGLTKLGRKFRLKNPIGMIHYCGLLQSRKNRSRISRMKYTVAAQAYAVHASVDQRKLEALGVDPRYLKRWARFPGRILLALWKRK